MLRRSLQTPNLNKPYLIKGYNIINIIKEALMRDKNSKGNILI
ncbi:hypothetical protein FOXYSP1_06518 [Fusarium oxysporum f. sp. phaseoli]